MCSTLWIDILGALGYSDRWLAEAESVMLEKSFLEISSHIKLLIVLLPTSYKGRLREQQNCVHLSAFKRWGCDMAPSTKAIPGLAQVSVLLDLIWSCRCCIPFLACISITQSHGLY